MNINLGGIEVINRHGDVPPNLGLTTGILALMVAKANHMDFYHFVDVFSRRVMRPATIVTVFVGLLSGLRHLRNRVNRAPVRDGAMMGHPNEQRRAMLAMLYLGLTEFLNANPRMIGDGLPNVLGIRQHQLFDDHTPTDLMVMSFLSILLTYVVATQMNRVYAPAPLPPPPRIEPQDVHSMLSTWLAQPDNRERLKKVSDRLCAMIEEMATNGWDEPMSFKQVKVGYDGAAHSDTDTQNSDTMSPDQLIVTFSTVQSAQDNLQWHVYENEEFKVWVNSQTSLRKEPKDPMGNYPTSLLFTRPFTEFVKMLLDHDPEMFGECYHLLLQAPTGQIQELEQGSDTLRRRHPVPLASPARLIHDD